MNAPCGKYTATTVAYTVAFQTYTATASQEIVLSAGSVQTPQLLELSGEFFLPFYTVAASEEFIRHWKCHLVGITWHHPPNKSASGRREYAGIATPSLYRDLFFRAQF